MEEGGDEYATRSTYAEGLVERRGNEEREAIQ